MPKSHVPGILQQGHRVASGQSENSPYPAGTIAMQTPYFKELGLDLSSYYPGTLNVSVAPLSFKLRHADFVFREVHWVEGFPSEDFSFVHCAIIYQQQRYPALIYYPHPETKIQHFQSTSVLEVLCEKVSGISYGDNVVLEYDESKIVIGNAKSQVKITK
jgi:hypothetical protein